MSTDDPAPPDEEHSHDSTTGGEAADETPPFDCDHEDCDRTFDTRMARKGHLAHHAEADSEDGSYPCPHPDCSESFDSPAAKAGHCKGHDLPAGGWPVRVDIREDIQARAPLRGFVPRIEGHEAHHRFLWAVRPPMAMISILRARQLLRNGHTATEWAPPETTVITSTTVPDEKLSHIPIHKGSEKYQADRASNNPNRSDRLTEGEIVEQFEADVHIPADYPVYGDMSEEEQVENARKCAEGTLYMAERLPDDIGVLPLIKGEIPEARRYCEAAAAALGGEMAAVYLTQHYSVGGGGGPHAARNLVRKITNETGGDIPLLTIGAASPRELEAMPESVSAGSAMHRWLTAVEPRSRRPEEMRHAYQDLAAETAGALGTFPTYDRRSLRLQAARDGRDLNSYSPPSPASGVSD
jgi:hypothetical protein